MASLAHAAHELRALADLSQSCGHDDLTGGAPTAWLDGRGRNWCGGNGSAYRDAILAVNGLDETMKYGGGDKEFGIRLANSGVKGRHLRFTAPLVHLDHPRGYKDPEKIRAHRLKIAEARRTGKIWAEAGIRPPEPAA